MRNKEYLTSGEVAKMVGVNKQTVIYYDKIGLLKPAAVMDKDYRAYRVQQADELDVILTFRSIGVSIAVLKDYLGRKSPEHCVEMLSQQEMHVNKEIERLEKIREKIRSRRKIMEEYINFNEIDLVKYLEVEKDEIFMVEACNQRDYDKKLKSFLALCSNAKHLSVDFANPVCGIIKEDDLKEGRYDNISYYGILIPDSLLMSINIEHTLVKEKGIYALGYHKGDSEDKDKTYAKIFDRIKADHYEIAGPSFEIDLYSALTNENSDEFLTGITFKVK